MSGIDELRQSIADGQWRAEVAAKRAIDAEIVTQPVRTVTIELTRDEAFGYSELLSAIAREERARQRGVLDSVTLSPGGLLAIETLAYQMARASGRKVGA